VGARRPAAHDPLGVPTADRQLTDQPPPLDPPPSPAPPRWGLGDAALAFGLGAVLASLLSAPVTRSSHDHSLPPVLLGLLGLWVGLVGVTVRAARRKGSGRVVEDFGLRAEPADIALGVAGAIAATIVEAVVVALIRSLTGPVKVSQDVGDAIKQAHGAVLAITFVLTVIAVPIVEELFFRGLLLRALERRLPAPAAIGASAVVFGLAHFQGGSARTAWTVVAGLAAVGLVLATLAHATRRLGPGIVAHALFNLLAFVSLMQSR
jgi:membrane protease YdiL (CAAX protease family)